MSKLAAAAVAATLLAMGCSVPGSGTPGSPAPSGIQSAAARWPAPGRSVIVISCDGLASRAITALGPQQLPHLHRLIAGGSSTLNARTETEMSVTLPNHTGMVTGRRIEAATGGHGVTWNDDRPQPATVQAAAGHDVRSVFDVVHNSGGSTALFASKTKFSLWQRSWPQALDRVTINTDTSALTSAVIADLGTTRQLRFVHLADADSVGHAKGWMSPDYLAAVRRVDRLVGRMVRALRERSAFANGTTLILTADHGGHGRGHYDTTSILDIKVPFIAYGQGVKRGGRLYRLNPDYRNPGTGHPSYAMARQPVRNGAVANLTTDLLRLGPVPGSEHNVKQNLDLR